MAKQVQQVQQVTPQQLAQMRSGPKRAELILHLFSTTKLVSAILTDRRVHVVRKAAYLGTIGALLATLLFPEALIEVASLFTVVFPFLEIPVDASVDWVTFAVATFSLLKVFPKEIVGEHYDRIFRR